MKFPVFTIVALLTCSWGPCAAANGAPDAASGRDVTLTLQPDDDTVAAAMARVIALPAQASARAPERVQRGIDRIPSDPQ